MLLSRRSPAQLNNKRRCEKKSESAIRKSDLVGHFVLHISRSTFSGDLKILKKNSFDQKNFNELVLKADSHL